MTLRFELLTLNLMLTNIDLWYMRCVRLSCFITHIITICHVLSHSIRIYNLSLVFLKESYYPTVTVNCRSCSVDPVVVKWLHLLMILSLWSSEIRSLYWTYQFHIFLSVARCAFTHSVITGVLRCLLSTHPLSPVGTGKGSIIILSLTLTPQNFTKMKYIVSIHLI